MGTCWSKGSELGVVAVTLGLALACGGKYDVGSGETGGRSGDAGAGQASSGGSSVTGQGGSNQGGSTSIGGQSGGDSSGTGGTPVAGASGSSGASTGGSAGTDACDFPVEPLPDHAIASPEVVWDRISRFMYGDTRAPGEPLPSVTDIGWVHQTVQSVLEEQYAEDGRAPGGLEDFFRDWALEGAEGTNVEFWASSFARGNFADFFAEVDGRVSFMSDRDFLVVHPDSSRRGFWMVENLVFYKLGIPPEPGDSEPVPAAPGKTRRQTMEETVSQSVCIGCHRMFDPLGFSLEHYDELGDYRTTENGLPIDASGTYDQTSEHLVFSSIDDLAGQLLPLCEVQSTFAQGLFEYALVKARDGSPPPYEAIELRYVIREFREADLELAPLLMAIASTPAFLSE